MNTLISSTHNIKENNKNNEDNKDVAGQHVEHHFHGINPRIT